MIFPNNTYNDKNDYINEYKLTEKATVLFNYLYNSNLKHILFFSHVIKDDFLVFEFNTYTMSFIKKNFNKPIHVQIIKNYIY